MDINSAWKAMKVLVVDDFPTMRRILRSVLAQVGIEDVVEADNGPNALDKMRGAKFDLVLSDWNMPKMTGMDLLRAVREDPDLRGTPFVLVAPESHQDEISKALQCGLSEFVVKPFNASILREKLAQVLKQ